MALQIIDVGSFPNSRDGDKLRDAVIKINANTTELYNENGTLYGIIDSKVDKVVGETLTPNKFTNADVAKLADAESISGAQTKANTAEQNAKDYADEGDGLLQLQIDSRALISETGYSLGADQETSTIYLRDKNNNILSSLPVGFLNNEGTTMVYNPNTKEIELRNDADELLSSFSTADLLTNVGSNINLNGATLELRDATNEVLSTATFNISNISGLQAELDIRETITNVDTKVAAAETNAIDWVKQFGLGSTVSVYNDNLDDLNLTTFVFAGSTATNKPVSEDGWVINQSIDNDNSTQIFISASGMFSRLQTSGVFSVWDQKETVAGAQAKADSAESTAISYAETGLALKVDKVDGLGLSQESFTTEEKTKLSTAESVTGAQTKADTAESNAKTYADTGDANLQTQIDEINMGTDFVNVTGDENIGGVKTFTDSTNFNVDIDVTGTIYEGGQSLSVRYETPAGSQTKADTAESNANSYTDTGLSTKVDKVTGLGLSQENFTTEEKTKLSTAESVTGAQDKADAAELAAKNYADIGDADLQTQIDNITTGDGFVDTTSDESIGGVKTFTANTNFEVDIDVTGTISEGGQLLSVKYETPTGAQTKADSAQSNAIAHADSGLSTKVDKVVGKQLSTEDFTTEEKAKLSTAESITGAQTKADTAQQNAIDYTDAELILKQNLLTTDDDSITIDELNNIRVNTETWDLVTHFNSQLNFE